MATGADVTHEELQSAFFPLGEWPDKDTRDLVLATGMTEGMETSYARLERELLSA